MLNVERVLVVDDLFAPPAAIYSLAFSEGDGPKLEGLPSLPDGIEYEEHVEQHWEDVPLDARLALRRRVLKEKLLDEDPTGDPTNLRQHVGDRYFRGMTLHEWMSEREKLLAQGKRALILFDVNFERETHDPDDVEGLGPAGQALTAKHNHIVGLLTNRAKRGDEQGAADTWAPRAHVPRADLVVVNKNFLGDPQNAKDLARVVEQVRAALQASQLRNLREMVQKSLEEGLRQAASTISADTPAVLEDLVFRASREGGEWEGDTWFRLYETLGLTSARKAVALDDRTRRAITDVRNLLHSRPRETASESAQLAAKVQQAEAYDEAEYLNRAGLPIANGDIFKTATGRAFILVGQPCDLMLRPNGRATHPATATLLPIKSAREDQDDGQATSSYRLPKGGPLGESDWEVRFRPESHVGFDVLDLVSFNSDGHATAKPRRGSRLEPLLPGLQERLDAITETASAAANLLETLDGLVDDEHITAAIANKIRHRILQAGGPFRAMLSGKPTPYAFDCKRVGRLAGTYADALLSAHAAARSRTVHAHELTRIVADDSSQTL